MPLRYFPESFGTSPHMLTIQCAFSNNILFPTSDLFTVHCLTHRSQSPDSQLSPGKELSPLDLVYFYHLKRLLKHQNMSKWLHNPTTPNHKPNK